MALVLYTAIQRWNAAQQQKFSETEKKPREGHLTLPIYVCQDRSTKDARLRSVGQEFQPLLGRTCAELTDYWVALSKSSLT